jgi:hypothetical protein
MIVIFETQRYENYGSTESTYWKPKGGRTIKVLNVPNDLTDTAIVGLYPALDIDTPDISDSVSYHHKYDTNAPVYDWEVVIDYSDIVNKLLETA